MNQLKKYKFFHWAYNLIHYKSLSHNKAAYRKYNIHKPVIASLSSKDFPDKESRAWLDIGDSRDLAPARAEFGSFSPGVQQSLLAWSEKGYLVVDGFFLLQLPTRSSRKQTGCKQKASFIQHTITNCYSPIACLRRSAG